MYLEFTEEEMARVVRGETLGQCYLFALSGGSASKHLCPSPLRRVPQRPPFFRATVLLLELGRFRLSLLAFAGRRLLGDEERLTFSSPRLQAGRKFPAAPMSCPW